jgi:RNA polymerase sigma factor (sigma-70 family)
MSARSDDFAALYRKHAPGCFRRASRLLRSETDAHEVVQDLFLSLCERPEQYQGKSGMTTWLYSATTHACLNRLRNQRTRQRLLRVHAPLSPPEAGERADTLSALRGVLVSLPEPLADLAVFYHFDQLSQEEIARLLGCSRRQVGNLLERLERLLAEKEEP